MKFLLGTIATILFTSGAVADCPASPPWTPNSFAAGDQKVTGDWLQKNLVGRKAVNAEGTEVYGKDGTYSYIASGQTYRAPSYRFYSNGMRCIGYSTPRFDYYVVNNGKLVGINVNGGRFEATISN